MSLSDTDTNETSPKKKKWCTQHW